MKKYKAILFDYDDTLVNTLEVKWDQHIETAKRFYNHTLTEEDLTRVWGEPFEQMIANLYGDVDSVQNIKNNYLGISSEFAKNFHQGAKQILSFLGKNNIPVAIITSMLGRIVEDELVQLGLDHKNFEFVQGAEDTIVHKPNPLVFEPSLEHFTKQGITNLEMVYVGDAIRDYQAAKNAGIDFIGVLTGLTSSAEFESVGAEYIQSFNELKKYIQA